MTKGIAPRAGRPSNERRAALEGPQGAVLRALVHPTRRRILLLLTDGAMAVHHIADRFPVSRPMVSKHLRILREAGLVKPHASGRERLYRLTDGDATRTALAIARADSHHADEMRRLRDHLEGS